jgi:hypothetical protein
MVEVMYSRRLIKLETKKQVVQEILHTFLKTNYSSDAVIQYKLEYLGD